MNDRGKGSLNWFERRQRQREVVDETAISLLTDRNAPGHPFYRSQKLAVAAQAEGRSDDARTYWLASRKIASVLGYRPGPKAFDESRSVKPTMKIEGRRIVRTTPWWHFWD